MIYREDGAFLNWIANRMIYSLGDNPNSWHINYLKQLVDRIFNYKINISDTKLDNIIAIDSSFITQDDNGNNVVKVKK